MVQAQRMWERVVGAFATVESERHWVELSRAGLLMLAQPSNRSTRPPLDREPVRKSAGTG